MGDLFDAAPMYDEDYLYFFAAPRGLSEFAVHGPVVPGADVPAEAAAELAWRLLDLRVGMSVLDLACGHGELAANRAVLDGIVRVLRPGGRLAMDLDDLTMFLASYCPSRVMAARENGDMLVDRYHLDAQTGRFEAERTDIRNGRARRMNFVKRLFGFPELRDWLLAAGFTTVSGYGEDARPLTADHRRMVIVAELP
jgi:hypothetical protein